MIRVCLAGITGWVGEPLAAAIAAADDLELVAAVARRGGERSGIPISTSVPQSLQTHYDVLVDYTSATAVRANVLAAIGGKRHVVIGSSGLSDTDYGDIDSAAREAGVGVIAVGNFAITAALLQRFAVEAARYLGSWEVIDSAYAGKMDAPSGMARELAWRMAQVRRPELAVPLKETVGDQAARGAAINDSRVHSLRLPGYTIGLEVRFGQEDERLTLSYDAGTGARPYIEGTLLAIRKVQEQPGLVRGLDRIL